APSLAAHAAHRDAHHRIARFRDETVLHALRRAHPVHVPPARSQLASDRKAGKNVPAGAGRHDEDGAAHAFPPLIRYRFSQSMRSRIASETQFTTMPVPPNESSGSVSPFVGRSPMLTPMLMNACTASHTPMPCATSAAK